MAKAQIEFVFLGTGSEKVVSQFSALNKEIEKLGTLSNSQLKSLSAAYDKLIASTGMFTAKTISLSSAAQHLGERLSKGKSNIDDWKAALKGVSQETSLFNQLGQRQVSLLEAHAKTLGSTATLYAQHRVNLSDTKIKSQVLTQALIAQNAALQQASTHLINWGKNTQWAGRQLTAGLVMPIALFSANIATAFKDVDENLTRLARVYGVGLETPTKAMLASVRKDVLGLAKDLGHELGISAKEVTDTAAQFAAAGLTGEQLVGATKQASRMIVLGEADKQEAIKATIALQTAYKLNTNQVTEATNFFNAAQAATSTSMGDLIEAIPKVGPVIQGLGGSYKDMVSMLTAMKEGGVPASEAANAIKNSLGRIINPTKAAKNTLMGFGIDIESIVNKNAGNLTGTLTELQTGLDNLSSLDRQRAISELFGKFQFARMAAFMDNFNKTGTQSAKVVEMMGMSAAELANIADEQTKKIQESASGKFKIAVQDLRNALLPMGEEALNVFTSLIGKVTDLVQSVENLPGPVKTFLKVFGGLAVFAGPMIMITGLFANLIGQFGKFGTNVRTIISSIIAGVNPLKVLGRNFHYLTEESVGEAKAAKLLGESIQASISPAQALLEVFEQMHQIIKGNADEMIAMSSTIAKAAETGGNSKAKALSISMNPVGKDSGNLFLERSAINVTRMSGIQVERKDSSGKTEWVSPGGLSQADIESIQEKRGVEKRISPLPLPIRSYLGSRGGIRKDIDPEIQKIVKDVLDDFKKTIADGNYNIKRGQLGVAEAYDSITPTINQANQMQLDILSLNKLIFNQDEKVLELLRLLDIETAQDVKDHQKIRELTQELLKYVRSQVSSNAELDDLNKKRIQAESGIVEADRLYEEIVLKNGAQFADNVGSIKISGAALTRANESVLAASQEASMGVRTTVERFKQASGKISSILAGSLSHIVAKTDEDFALNKWAREKLVKTTGRLENSENKLADSNEKNIKATEKNTAATTEETASRVTDTKAHIIETEATIANTTASKLSLIERFKNSKLARGGTGIGLSMAGGMIGNALPEGMAGKETITKTAEFSGLGLMFGPYGAVAGAAIGLLVGGFKELEAASKRSAAALRGAAGGTTEDFQALGMELQPLTTTLPEYDKKLEVAKTAVDEFTQSIRDAADTSSLKAFGESLKTMTNEQRRTALTNKATSLAAGGMNQTQVATVIQGYMNYAGIFESIKPYMDAAFSSGGKVLGDAMSKSISSALESAGGAGGQNQMTEKFMQSAGFGSQFGVPASAQTKEYTEAVSSISTSVQAMLQNTDVSTFLEQVNGINQSMSQWGQSSNAAFALSDAIKGLTENSADLSTLRDKLIAAGKDPQEQLLYLKAAIMGIGGSIENLPKMTTVQIEVLMNQKAAADAAQNVFGDIASRKVSAGSSGGSSGSSGASKAADKQIAANNKIIDQIKKQQAERKKLIDLQNKELDFSKTKLGLENQIREALANGEYLKAAELRNELAVTEAKKNQEDTQTALDNADEARIAALEEQNKLLQEKKSSSGGSGGGSSSKAESNISATLQAEYDATLKNINLRKKALTTYGEFENSTEWKSFAATMKKYGATEEEIAKKAQEMWQATVPTEEALKGTDKFATTFKEKMQTTMNESFSPQEWKNKSAIATMAALTEAQKQIDSNKLSGTSFSIKARIEEIKLSYDALKAWNKSAPKGMEFTGVGAVGYAKGGIIGYASGGVFGPGTGTSDSIPAMLSNGEYVIKATSVSKYGKAMLDAVNAGTFNIPSVSSPSFSTPGDIQTASVSNSSNNVTINADFKISGTDPKKVADEVMDRLSTMQAKHGGRVRI